MSTVVTVYKIGNGPNLQTELLQLEVQDVRTVRGAPVSAGAKAGDAITVGALVILMVPTLATAVLDVVVSWLRRQSRDIEVVIAGHRLKGQVTRQQRDAIVAAYLQTATQPKQQ